MYKRTKGASMRKKSKGGAMRKMSKGGTLKKMKTGGTAMKMTTVNGRKVPAFAADGKGKMMMGGAKKKDKMMRMGVMMDSDKYFMYGGKTQKMMKGGKMNYPGGGKMKKESMYPGGGRMQHD